MKRTGRERRAVGLCGEGGAGQKDNLPLPRRRTGSRKSRDQSRAFKNGETPFRDPRLAPRVLAAGRRSHAGEGLERHALEHIAFIRIHAIRSNSLISHVQEAQNRFSLLSNML